MYVCKYPPTFARFEPQAQRGVGGPEPVLQQFLLEANDGGEHGLALDLSGRDHDAAVHEVCHGVRQLTGALRLERRLVEHLGWRWGAGR